MPHTFKYESGQYLYYVDPFIFTIHLVQIDYTFFNDEGKFYMVGEALLKEEDLFHYLPDAKHDAITRLKKFYDKRMWEISHCDPDKEGLETYEDDSSG